jgi:hypothetical protein
LLPFVITRDAGPRTQGRFENPRRFGIRQLRFAGNGAANFVEPAAIAFDDQLEGAKIVAVLELQFAGSRKFHKQGNPPFTNKAILPSRRRHNRRRRLHQARGGVDRYFGWTLELPPGLPGGGIAEESPVFGVGAFIAGSTSGGQITPLL